MLEGFAIASMLLLIGCVVAVVAWLKSRSALQRYRPIQDVETARAEIEAKSAEAQERLERTRHQLQSEEARLEDLRSSARLVEDELEMQSFAFYKAKYDFPDASTYERRLEKTRAEQKQLIKDDKACVCPTEWTVSGSKAEGRKMVKRQVKLMLRAFNGECDAAIAKVRYNNAANLEKRIERSFEQINKLGEVQQISITPNYLNLKLAELYLVHEHREKVQEEKEEQRRIKEQMREEQKAEKEIEKIRSESEKEEARYQKALEKAREELRKSEGALHEKMKAQVDKLERELSEAIDRKAKAMARAQLTRSGHVYVLSNIGSFGEGIYKIGMTRRFEPLDRVKELGDASVPFGFDVHAMIYCEDAPTLENALHKAFHERRVNRINLRREYFRVTLEEIQRLVAEHHGVVSFVKVPKAEEYRKTLAMEAEARAAQTAMSA